MRWEERQRKAEGKGQPKICNHRMIDRPDCVCLSVSFNVALLLLSPLPTRFPVQYNLRRAALPHRWPQKSLKMDQSQAARSKSSSCLPIGLCVFVRVFRGSFICTHWFLSRFQFRHQPATQKSSAPTETNWPTEIELIGIQFDSIQSQCQLSAATPAHNLKLGTPNSKASRLRNASRSIRLRLTGEERRKTRVTA